MDERLAALDRRVAEAADAWLADSRDTGVYARLVSAIEARSAYLHPLLELGHPEALRQQRPRLEVVPDGPCVVCGGYPEDHKITNHAWTAPTD